MIPFQYFIGERCDAALQAQSTHQHRRAADGAEQQYDAPGWKMRIDADAQNQTHHSGGEQSDAADDVVASTQPQVLARPRLDTLVQCASLIESQPRGGEVVRDFDRILPAGLPAFLIRIQRFEFFGRRQRVDPRHVGENRVGRRVGTEVLLRTAAGKNSFDIGRLHA